MVTTDTHAIRMYFDETSCGFIPKGNEKAAVEALKNVYNKPDEEIQQQCALAYKQIKKFSANYCYDLIRKMLEV